MSEAMEFLALFSDMGPYRVTVKFKDHPGRVADRQMMAEEIIRLIDRDTGMFAERMEFDGWPFDVVKFDLDPVRKKLTIHARRPSGNMDLTD
ncbi:MAG: hypothetical protein PHI49_08575 [Halothiobacillaceae bacterium]|nr:hypothetical protein [Halothiobacillaceae bacterium]